MARLWGFSLLVAGWAGICAGGAIAASETCRVLLVPGAIGGNEGGSGFFIKNEEYFREHREYFQSRGCEVRQAVLAMDGSIAEHARSLRDQVEAFAASAPDAPIWIFAHSQGALDTRFMLRMLTPRAQVSAVVDIGAPHQGSPVADWAMDHLQRRSWLYELLRSVFSYDLSALAFLPEMTPDFLRRYAQSFEAVKGVRYASARGVCRSGCHFTLWASGLWFGVGEGDGLVPSASQRFGEDLGEFNLDHLSQVGVDEGKRAERTRLLDSVFRFFSVSE